VKTYFEGEEPLAKLREFGGYYECPKDKEGKRLGPLVGYAAEYEPGKHWVGDIYLNAASVERCPEMLNDFACELAEEILREFGEID
jgi:hypothetical protein